MGRWHFPARLLLLIPYGFLPWGADAPSLGFLWSFQTWRIWSISKHHGELSWWVFDLIFARNRFSGSDCRTRRSQTHAQHVKIAEHIACTSKCTLICSHILCIYVLQWGAGERNLTFLFRYQDGHWPSHAGARCDGGQPLDWRDDLPAAHDTGLTEVPVWVTGMWCCVFSQILGGNVAGDF